MSGVDQDALQNFLDKQESDASAFKSKEKFEVIKAAQVKEKHKKEIKAYQLKIKHLKETLSRAGNTEQVLAYDKLKSKYKNVSLQYEQAKKALARRKAVNAKINFERDFLVNRIKEVYKQEGLNKIINHIDCPEDLRGLLT